MTTRCSKELFCKALTQLKKVEDFRNKVDDMIRKEFSGDSDFLSPYGITPDHELLVVDLLSALMNDDDGWISWWVWDRNYGRDVAPNSIMYRDKHIDVRTPEKLYDFLLQEMEDNNATEHEGHGAET